MTHALEKNGLSGATGPVRPAPLELEVLALCKAGPPSPQCDSKVLSMNIVKSALRHIQAVLPKSWHLPSRLARVQAVDSFEMQQPVGRGRHMPAVDWAEMDRRLPQGDPLQVMDQVLGSSTRYTLVPVHSVYAASTTTTASQSQMSLLLPPAPTEKSG